MVWVPYSQLCSHSRPTSLKARLQRALSDEVMEGRISSVIHSEPDLPNNRILCLPLSVTHLKSSQSENFQSSLHNGKSEQKMCANGGEIFMREQKHGLNFEAGMEQPSMPRDTG